MLKNDVNSKQIDIDELITKIKLMADADKMVSEYRR
jgi:hypothetical protein